MIVGGDINAWNTWWGSANTNSRGEEILGFFDEMDFQVLNVGPQPTFDCIRGGKRFTSHVDVSVCSTDVANLVEDWKVIDNLTSSDHNGITFKILHKKSKGIKIERTTRLYNTKKANWAEFHEKLAQFKSETELTYSSIDKINNKNKLELTLTTYSEIITKACNQTIPKKKKSHILTVPWWSEKLAALKREVTTRKRRIRCAAPIRRAGVVDEYLKKKEEYELEVNRAKVDSWKEFCGKQDGEGVWTGIYRVIGKTSNREEDLPLVVEGKTLSAIESVRVLAETFYPEDDTSADNGEHSVIRAKAERVNDGQQDDLCDPPFTHSELKAAVNSFNPRKAPGVDGLTADICKAVIYNDPELYLKLVNKCLELSLYPKSWKQAVVVVLRKPGKDTYTAPKSYRPIGLLPVLGKIFEKLIVARLKFYLIPKISACQYGFMPQRCTEDSLYTLMQHIYAKLNQKQVITMVSLDIEGAFDSAWWPAIRVRLAHENCPINLRRVMDSYLQDRTVRVRYAGEEHTRNTNKGCVQGSIAGPLLWNLLLDPLLAELNARGEYVQAFADDIVLVFDGRTAQDIQKRANATLEHVRAWGVKYKLKFAPHKTMAMTITRKLKFDTPRLSMGGVDIGMSKEIKLLGLTIDESLTFRTHTTNVCQKALGFYRQLARTARVHWGLQPEIIKLMYTAVVEPTIMYAASAWAPATSKKCVQKELNNVQRGFAQKIVKGYRTISLNSALLLAGLLPLDIRIREAATLFKIKRGEPHEIMGDLEVDKPMPFSAAPHPALHEEPKFTCLPDGAAFDQHFSPGLNIFTDGSKIDGKVGAALTIRTNTTEICSRKLKLDASCSVYQAEILALHAATEEALKDGREKCSIYCDSRSALETVTDLTSLHPLALKIRANIQNMKENHKILQLFWIKAHAGLEGNERADELAKSAALHLKKRPDYARCPVSFVKRQIRQRSLDEWNQRYKESSTASITKVFFPDALRAYKTLRSMKLCPITVQLFTGHGGFSSYLHRFKCKEDPACPCDPEAQENAIHVVTDCPIYCKEKLDIEYSIDTDINIDTLSSIVENKLIRNRFIEYCVNIVKKVVSKNKSNVNK